MCTHELTLDLSAQGDLLILSSRCHVGEGDQRRSTKTGVIGV